MTRPLRVLLVGPSFHGYTTSIGKALAGRGHQVRTHLYDLKPGLRAKVRHKVVAELPERLGLGSSWTRTQHEATESALQALRSAPVDVVLAIKADSLTVDFWEAASASGALTHLWLYDEIRRMRIDPDVIPMVDLLTSYSQQDTADFVAQGLAASHVANGFDSELTYTRRTSDDILFIGAKYPNRADLLLELHRRGLPITAVGRDWSPHPVDRLRTWRVRRPEVPAQRDVTRSEAYGLMGGAVANLNLHFNQDGFTMRTFEIPGTGGLQLIDRQDISAMYDPGTEVAVWSTVDEAAELCRRAVTDRRWARTVGEAGLRRTLAEHTLHHRARDIEALWTA